MNFLVLASNSFTDVKPGLIIWTWITFIIVLFILRRFAWGPLLSAVEGREKNITNAIESAKRERAEAEKLLGEQKTAIASARQEAADAVRKTLVIAEGHGWFLRRYDATRGLQFLAMVEAMTPLGVVSVGRREHRAGVEILRRFSDQQLTLTDAVGMHVMGERSVGVCWSTDFHLGLTGVPLVIHQE